MDAAFLLENFETIAEAPGGVKRLRELILRLAVEGRLVPQDQGEADPDRTNAMIEEALKQRAKKRRAKVRSAPDVELGFALPPGWIETRLGGVLDLVNGKAFKKNEWSTSGLPIVRIQNLNNAEAPYNYFEGDPETKVQIDDGDLLVSWSGTPGTSFGAFIWSRGKALLNQHIFKAEILAPVFEPQFLRTAINARLDVMIGAAHGAVGLRHITKGKLEAIVLPVPPLGEQHRIVARVDELMGLCDELEAALVRKLELTARFSDAATAFV